MIDEDEEYGLRCTVGQLESERDGYVGELTQMAYEVGFLRRKNERLERENERLRSCLTDADENARLIMAENAKLREELSDVPKCESCEAMLDCDECLRADASQKERKRLDYENAKLRELVEDMLDCIEIRAAWHRPPTEGMCEEFTQRARDLGVDNDDDDWGSDGIRE